MCESGRERGKEGENECVSERKGGKEGEREGDQSDHSKHLREFV